MSSTVNMSSRLIFLSKPEINPYTVSLFGEPKNHKLSEFYNFQDISQDHLQYFILEKDFSGYLS